MYFFLTRFLACCSENRAEGSIKSCTPFHWRLSVNKAFVFILGLATATATATALAEDLDKRQVVTITQIQRDHILGEMRTLLAGIQNILAALSRDDMAAIARYARPLGMSMAHKAEGHLKSVLPKEFMRLGMSVHQSFDQIAADAETLKDSKHTLQQLSDSMKKCVACHASYQIRTAEQPLKSTQHPGHHGH